MPAEGSSKESCLEGVRGTRKSSGTDARTSQQSKAWLHHQVGTIQAKTIKNVYLESARIFATLCLFHAPTGGADIAAAPASLTNYLWTSGPSLIRTSLETAPALHKEDVEPMGARYEVSADIRGADDYLRIC